MKECKLKCFFKEGTYSLDVYSPNGSRIGGGEDVIKYVFEENYVLLKTTWKIGSFPTTIFTSKFFMDGTFTQTDTSGRDVCGKWMIRFGKLCIEIAGVDYEGNRIKGRYNGCKVRCGYNQSYYQLDNEKCKLEYNSKLRLKV